jgi:transposase
MKKKQRVADMADEVLARQARDRARRTGEPFEEALEAVRKTEAGLPPYSPDFNPIEQAFSKVKALLRRAEGRTRAALIEAMGQALWAVTARDTRGFFDHCGYRTLGQLL